MHLLPPPGSGQERGMASAETLRRASPYQGHQVCLTTCHGKERALALPFRLGLGLELVVCRADTDSLGTFSGEVERRHDALTTCRQKALLGLHQTGLSLGLASEASFGPNPTVPLLAAGQECLLFLDRERDLCVVEQRVEWRTNYGQRRFAAGEDPSPWLRQIGFPDHAVIVSPASPSSGLLFKGIRSAGDLEDAIRRCRDAQSQSEILLQTDMRAHLNPTRLRSIRRLGLALVRRLQRCCPECGAPGWGRGRTEPGLPCRGCGSATAMALHEIWVCGGCGAERRMPRTDGLIAADPGRCDWCNP